MTVKNAKTIYDALKGLGLTRAQVRKLLPDWWSPEIEKQPGGLAELCLLVSRRLNIELTALMDGHILKSDAALSIAYKHRADATVESLQASTCISTSLAKAVVAAMSKDYSADHFSGAGIAATARRIGSGTVSLTSLIDASWAMGIPVIPVTNLPVGVRKMDGAVIKVDGRPVIIISKKKSSRAWLAFIVAHEIGHIASGHLEINDTIIDVSLQEQATYAVESSRDMQEREADSFALSLLGGDGVDREISTWPSWASPADLAVRARKSAADLRAESGHIILRYAFESKRWPDAMAALRFLSEDSDAETVVRGGLQRNLDFDLVAEDLRDLICQVTGIQIP
ncbi:ImmA/IrrE family metallo-endopeptidase [uncultured Desulfuromusa sp.]|uniref:ImmA/IrrE family metallo-endopeptidase n=1 Tax=uncultured Desulfuromusa sp. TaxID=219183 RepID=UPI002AA6477E|nr:ImmA/IrrE family metallo-endopeptidase [uncultured Desulfuromusa sp.]